MERNTYVLAVKPDNADAFTFTTVTLFPSIAFSKLAPEFLGIFALVVILVEICIILSTGSLIIVSEIIFLSISISFLYFTLYFLFV